MARIETDPNYTTPTFSRATAATDLFKKEDVQGVAAALSTHDHTSGKGLVLPANSITSAMIQDGAINSNKILDASILGGDIATGTIGTAQYGDNTITTAKVQTGNQIVAPSGTPLNSFGGQGFSTTSTSPVWVSPLRAAISCFAGSYVLAGACGYVGNSSGGTVVGINYDGSFGLVANIGTGYMHFSVQGLYGPMTAGVHNWDLYLQAGPGTAQCSPSNSFTIWAIEFKR